MKWARGEGRFFGTDISANKIEKATEGGHTCFEFSKGDAERLDFPDSKFDLVMSNAVFHWVPNKLQALREMHRVAKPNGMVAISFNGRHHYQEMAPIVATAMRMAENRGYYPQVRSYYEYATSFLTLEETDRLFDDAGFVDKNIYAIQRVVYSNPQQTPLIAGRGTTDGLWRVGLPPDLLESIQKVSFDEVMRLSTDKGIKLTSYHIIAYGRKPESP